MLLSTAAVNRCLNDRRSLAGQLFQLHYTQNTNKPVIVDSTATSPLVLSSGELDETYECVVFDSGTLAQLCENMTSSTKPEVNNVLHCRQRMTEPRPQVTCTENLLEFRQLLLKHASCQTDRQTKRQTQGMLIAIFRTPTAGKVNIYPYIALSLNGYGISVATALCSYR